MRSFSSQATQVLERRRLAADVTVKSEEAIQRRSKSIKIDQLYKDTVEDETDATSLESKDNASGHVTEPRDQPRSTSKRGVLQPRLLPGLGALVVAAVCVFAALIILLVSNGSPVDDWPVQPSVYLAIVTAFTNTAIALARLEAIPTAWWYSASRGGTVELLERQYQVTRSVVQALRYLRRPSLLTFACIFAVLVAIDNPLIQRASVIESASKNMTMDVNIAAQLPQGFSGLKYWRYTELGQSSIQQGTQTSEEAVLDFLQNRPIYLELAGCGEVCKTTVLGPGMEVWKSNTTIWPITQAMMYSVNASWGVSEPYIGPGYKQLDMFTIMGMPISEGLGQQDYLTAIGRLRFSPRNDSNFVYTVYYVRPATRKYNITLTRSQLSVDHSEFVSWANNTHTPMQDQYSRNLYHLATIDDFSSVVNSVFTTSYQVSLGRDYGHGPWVMPYGVNAQFLKYIEYTSPIDFYFRDPFPDVLSTYNGLMLRGGIMSSSWTNITELLDPGTAIHQRVQVQTFPTVFHSDFRWWAGAACIELMTILLVLAMFWGSWTLETDFNLSPFNTALAFDAPLFRDINPTMGAKGVVQAMGSKRIAFRQAKRFVPVDAAGMED